MTRRLARALWLCAAVPLAGACVVARTALGGPPETVTVRLDEGPVNRFVPTRTFGGAVDGHEQGETAEIDCPQNFRAMLRAGLYPLTYRLRTELAIDDWHWNPAGAWTDPRRQEGYWTSDSRPGPDIPVSYGYSLPRRGTTIDNAANQGYSRLDDGHADTFWKSNPYLDKRYTSESNLLHPQWIVIDLGRHKPLNRLRIDWAEPYARRFRVEYWSGSDDQGDNDTGSWQAFPGGVVSDGRGGMQELALAPHPVSARFVRLLLVEGSGTALPGSSDERDRLGFAIREIYLGEQDPSGRFHDSIRHGPRKDAQTLMFASSTDPWHRAIDRDPHVEQPGFDLIYHSGLTRGQPMLVPVPILFSTPENAAAEIRYLEARRYPLRRVELGEEPDGQFVTAEDYGALYLQFAAAIQRVDPHLELGGPSFQSPELDVLDWPERPRSSTWLGRFLNYLRRRGKLSDYRFCSLEWYPYDDICHANQEQLLSLKEKTRRMLLRLRESGLPPGTPLMITEYGYSAFSGEAEVDLRGAVLSADLVGTFLTSGGSRAYLYGYEPAALERNANCGQWGNNTILLLQEDSRPSPTAAFYGARLVDRDWVIPGRGIHTLFRADSTIRDGRGGESVSAYAVRRPDRSWGILLVNKDVLHPHAVKLQFRTRRGVVSLQGRLRVIQYSAAEYRWHPGGPHGYALPDRPPLRRELADGDRLIHVPPLSITAVQGRGPA